MNEFQQAVTMKGQTEPCLLCEATAFVINRFIPPEALRLRVPEIEELAPVGKVFVYTLCRQCNGTIESTNDYSSVDNRIIALAITVSAARRLRNAFSEIERLNHGRKKVG